MYHAAERTGMEIGFRAGQFDFGTDDAASSVGHMGIFGFKVTITVEHDIGFKQLFVGCDKWFHAGRTQFFFTFK